MAATGLLLAAASPALADTQLNTSPTTGGENTNFTIGLPGGASCPTASSEADGDFVDSFIVNSADVPIADLDSIQFLASNDYFPTYNSYLGYVLFDTSGNPYSDKLTNPPASGQTSGGLVAAAGGPFNYSPYDGSYGPGNALYAGTWYVGVACVTPSGSVDAGSLWYAGEIWTGTTDSSWVWTTTAPPTLTGVSLSALGRGASSVKVTLTGTGFVSGATVSSTDSGVSFASTKVVNSTTITTEVTVKSTAPTGPLTLTVKDPAGETGGCSTCLKIDPSPKVSKVSPATVDQGKSATVTFTGTNFLSTPTLTIAGTGVTISNVKFVSSTKITASFAVSSSATTGSRKITLTNPDHGTTTSKITIGA